MPAKLREMTSSDKEHVHYEKQPTETGMFYEHATKALINTYQVHLTHFQQMAHASPLLVKPQSMVVVKF